LDTVSRGGEVDGASTNELGESILLWDSSDCEVMNLLREIAGGLGVLVATLVILYVAVGAACLILGLCMYLSPSLFGNYFGLAILTAAWIVVGIAYLVVCALSNLWNWWDERRNL
jgi:hypothetical protein